MNNLTKLFSTDNQLLRVIPTEQSFYDNKFRVDCIVILDSSPEENDAFGKTKTSSSNFNGFTLVLNEQKKPIGLKLKEGTITCLKGEIGSVHHVPEHLQFTLYVNLQDDN